MPDFLTPTIFFHSEASSKGWRRKEMRVKDNKNWECWRNETKIKANYHASCDTTFSDYLLEKKKQQRYIIFLLPYQEYHVVVRVEIGEDFWVATVIRDDVYDTLNTTFGKRQCNLLQSSLGWLIEQLRFSKLALAQTILNPSLTHGFHTKQRCLMITVMMMIASVVHSACLPHRTHLYSCLGMDKVIVSTTEDEKNNVPSVSDIAECWADIYNKVFIDEAVTKHLQVFKPNFLRTVEHTVLHQQIKVPRQNVSEIFDSDGHWGWMEICRKAAR